MSILSDSSILSNIECGDIKIFPFNPKNLGSNSYDVTLSKNLLVYESDLLDPKKNNPFRELIIPEDGYILEPGKIHLGVTVEFTETLKHIIMFEGKSSLARLGLIVHITAGFGDVGFKGHITLELSCIQPIIIYPNMKIGQVYYQTVEGMVINPYSSKVDAKYNNEVEKPLPSMMYKNFPSAIEERRNRISDSGVSFDNENLSE